MNPPIIKYDFNKYFHLSLWMLVELTSVVRGLLKAYGVEDRKNRSTAELVFAVCNLLDATSAEEFGKHVKPVLGFRDLTDPASKAFTIFLPEKYSSIHDLVYRLIDILNDHPEFKKITDGKFTNEDIRALAEII